MIFGSTDEERKEAASLKAYNAITFPKRRFAFLPVRLDSGSYVFWEHYWDCRNGYLEYGRFSLEKRGPVRKLKVSGPYMTKLRTAKILYPGSTDKGFRYYYYFDEDNKVEHAKADL